MDRRYKEEREKKIIHRNGSNLKHICICCESTIINKNKNARYCKNCAKHINKITVKYMNQIRKLKSSLKEFEMYSNPMYKVVETRSSHKEVVA